MKTKIIKKTKENHKLVCSLYQASKGVTASRTEYDIKVLSDNGVNPFLEVVEVEFKDATQLVHSIFICVVGEEEVQLIFVY